MIFLTLGTQLPFDRLVRAMDIWCADTPDQTVFGQIATSSSENYLPKNFEWKDFVEPDEFKSLYEEADLIVAHAGMGSIITALTGAKRIMIMPRSAALNEHRNDHQMATANRFKDRENVYVADNEHVFSKLLTELIEVKYVAGYTKADEFAEPSLINAIRDFIHQD